MISQISTKQTNKQIKIARALAPVEILSLLALLKMSVGSKLLCLYLTYLCSKVKYSFVIPCKIKMCESVIITSMLVSQKETPCNCSTVIGRLISSLYLAINSSELNSSAILFLEEKG